MHKEHELADVEARYPAAHYVMVDDKLRILAAIKKIWGSRVTTVFVRQGHYALDPKILAACPAGGPEHRAHRRFVELAAGKTLFRGQPRLPVEAFDILI